MEKLSRTQKINKSDFPTEKQTDVHANKNAKFKEVLLHT